MFQLRLVEENCHRTNLAISTPETYPRTSFKHQLGCTWHGPYYQEWKDDITWYRQYHYRISDLMVSRLETKIDGYEDRHRLMIMDEIYKDPLILNWYNIARERLHTIKCIKDFDMVMIDTIITGSCDSHVVNGMAVKKGLGIDIDTLHHTEYPEKKFLDHQKQSLALYILLGYANNWGQQRTGKSPPTIRFNYELFKQRLINTCLVVCTASNKWTWHRELGYWLPSMIQALSQVIEGSKGKRSELLHEPGIFKIINYDSLKASIHDVRLALKGLNWSIVLDEVQHIKNPSQRTDAVTSLFNNYENPPLYAHFLSGTPVANTPIDVQRPVNLTAPGLLAKDVDDFRDRYIYGTSSNLSYKKGATKEIHARMARCSTRVTREACGLELGLVIEPQILEMSEIQAKVYNDIESILQTEFMTESGEMVGIKVNSFLARMQKLIQVTDGFLFAGPDDPKWLPESSQPKLKWLKKYINDYLYDIGKLIILSRFTPVLDMLQQTFAKHGVARLCGKTKQGKARDDEVVRFTTNKNCRILVMNPSVAKGQDLNPCQWIIAFDRMFYLEPNEQADARITGHNQAGEGTIMPLICHETIDEVLVKKILPKKRKLAAEVMGDKTAETDGKLGSITRDDIAEMLHL